MPHHIRTDNEIAAGRMYQESRDPLRGERGAFHSPFDGDDPVPLPPVLDLDAMPDLDDYLDGDPDDAYDMTVSNGGARFRMPWEPTL
jgi:hypothetical protein